MMKKHEALRVLAGATPQITATESVSLDRALGRVLAHDVLADMNIPPFNRSAMDGYAFRADEVPQTGGVIEICGIVPAGEVFSGEIGPGQGVKIMTGAPVPDGADCVQMVEKTKELDDGRVEIQEGCALGQNVAPCGQDMQVGEVILHQGITMRPIEIGMLATLGQSQVLVYRQPTVRIHATGDELVPPGGGKPGPGQIRESNGSMLAAQVRALGLGIDAQFAGIIADSQEATRRAIEEGLEADVLILSGGVSMGDFDHVHHELKNRGLEVLIEKVAMKPGKPLLFGFLNRDDGSKQWVFGLPGNPVSSYCTFELFVRPFLRGLIGLAGPHTLVTKANLLRPIRGKSIRRTQHLPARVTMGPGGLEVSQVEWHGSGDLRGLLDANGFIIIEANEPVPSVGDFIEVILTEPEPLRLPAQRSRELT